MCVWEGGTEKEVNTVIHTERSQSKYLNTEGFSDLSPNEYTCWERVGVGGVVRNQKSESK